MTKTIAMISHKNYNLSANEAFVIFLNSKLITCFIDGFTSKIKSQSIGYWLNGSEHTYMRARTHTKHSLYALI
jgi:hypothetical protein